MRLIDFLGSTEYFDGELYASNGAESEFSFVWDSEYYFTDFAKKKYSEILESEIRIDANKNLKLMRESINEEFLTEFLALCAGHVPQSYYNECIKEVQNE